MSRKNFGAKPYSFPQPVFIIASYDENGIPCAMNAAWCGISEATEVTMCISPSGAVAIATFTHRTSAHQWHVVPFWLYRGLRSTETGELKRPEMLTSQ